MNMQIELSNDTLSLNNKKVLNNIKNKLDKKSKSFKYNPFLQHKKKNMKNCRNYQTLNHQILKMVLH